MGDGNTERRDVKRRAVGDCRRVAPAGSPRGDSAMDGKRGERHGGAV